ncbi:flippase-like domain-containing protein [Salibacteraceae bacterium]|nr:flippase-like domain-containing protein [Salibacteraceae bacterium]
MKSALQVLFSLTLGFFLIWFIYKDLTEEDKSNMLNSIKGANYWWLLGSMLVAVLSHVFRAYRWKYPLEALDIKINLANRFAAVMIGYIANLAFPRLGEVTRCAVLSRYQKHPFEKLFGTVIAERVVDAVILLLLIILAVVMQYSILQQFLLDAFGPLEEKVQTFVLLGIAGVLGVAAVLVGWQFITRSKHPFALKTREKITGLVDGFATIKNMKGQVQFYFHTIMIWGCYVLVFVLSFQSFPETADVPFGGMLASFVLGGLSIVAVQGGLGAYPLAIMLILSLYGVSENTGYAFGWIVWTIQTAMIILLGFISMLIMPLLNASSNLAADESK